jgi:hypothetical protein
MSWTTSSSSTTGHWLRRTATRVHSTKRNTFSLTYWAYCIGRHSKYEGIIHIFYKKIRIWRNTIHGFVFLMWNFIRDTKYQEIRHLLYREIRLWRTTEEGFVILMCNFNRDRETKKKERHIQFSLVIEDSITNKIEL